jgi:hypothetical protein
VQPSEDGLGYLAIARMLRNESEEPDWRCVRLSLDQHGRRTAVDDEGSDTSADCWNQL